VKIKVRSRYREGVAVTGRVWDDEKVHLQFRAFAPPHPKANFGETYMSPQEARFLVESKQNRMHVEAGLEPEYSYPAGYPMPVADNLDGPFAPPMTEKNFHVSDPRQIEQAQNWMAERAASMALAEARRAAEDRGDDPNEVALPTSEPVSTTESASARRSRVKADREAQRAASPL